MYLGYVPLGAVLASRTLWPTLGAATAVSGFAEVSQFFADGRAPSVIDLLANVMGAVIGWGLGSLSGFPFQVLVTRRRALIAAAASMAYVIGGTDVSPRDAERDMRLLVDTPRLIWATANPRGATLPGRLEAHWKLDEAHNEITPDASGTGPSGELINGAKFIDGIDGAALKLNGVNQYVNFGDSQALRLTGSMTISAWINSSAFPRDDAAIVSAFSGLGYQLDTTIDQGSRTVGFKLANASGRLMARYGKTRLETGRWYHVAGVYDTAARTLNVYVNGRADNGCLFGEVTDRQRISGLDVYIGKRGAPAGYEFAGAIDDVRIYSRALEESEIVSDMRASAKGERYLETSNDDISARIETGTEDMPCRDVEPRTDVRSAALFLAFGQMVAVTCVGLWPMANYKMWCVVLSLAAGLVLTSLAGSTAPYVGGVVVLLTFVGGVSVAAGTTTIED